MPTDKFDPQGTADPPAAKSETVRFVSDARLISVLGEQLIGSEKVGILELIKNAYDAGAKKCNVLVEGVPGLEPVDRTLSEYKELPGPIIEIADNGAGMTREDIIAGWLRPASSRRARAKERLRLERQSAVARGALSEYDALVKRLKVAHGGRLPLGEKGIGRLATHRLGSFLWLRTKTSNDPFEWELRIAWDRFDALGESALDLSAVELTLRHQAPTYTWGPDGQGTVLCCYGGRNGYAWSRNQIVDVGRAVNALRSPRQGPKNFDVSFASPHVAESELGTPLERHPAPFNMLALVNDQGIAEIEFTFNPPPGIGGVDRIHEPFSLDLRTVNTKKWAVEDSKQLGAGNSTQLALPLAQAPHSQGTPAQSKKVPILRLPTCGQFLVHLRAWLRINDWLGTDFRELTTYLDEYGGVAVFRDGLSTLPAQQAAKNDWLGLSQAQIKKASNISYYHLAGEVELDQTSTPLLVDRSSREGIIETRPYLDLSELTKAVVAQLQLRMKTVRAAWQRSRGIDLSNRRLRSEAKVVSKVLDSIVQQYDFERDEFSLGRLLGSGSAAQSLAKAAETMRGLDENLRLLADERDGLVEMAGFGLAISVAVHEISKIAGGLAADTARILQHSGDSAIVQLATRVKDRAEALLGETQRLAPLRVTRAESATPNSIRAAVESARAIFARALEDKSIEISVGRGDFRVKMKRGQLVQVFANLFDNAIYWISSQFPEGRITIEIDEAERRVTIADTGPGVSRAMLPHLFQPFYSEKQPASGLGLYICKHYLERCSATIRSLPPSAGASPPGARFELDFAKSPRE